MLTDTKRGIYGIPPPPRPPIPLHRASEETASAVLSARTVKARLSPRPSAATRFAPVGMPERPAAARKVVGGKV
jgi:hypothetical protein